MAENTKKEFLLFSSQIQPIIEEQKSSIAHLKKISQHKNSAYTTIAIIAYRIKIIDNLFEIEKKHYEFFQRNDSSVLDLIRKELNITLQEIKVSFHTNISINFNENSSKLQELTELTPKRLFNILSQLETFCRKLDDCYDKNRKYINTLTNIYSEICGFALNSINFKNYFMDIQDFQNPEYKDIKKLLDLMITLFNNTAEMYMKTFYITRSKDVLNNAIEILSVMESYCRLSKNTDLIPDILRKKESLERMLNN